MQKGFSLIELIVSVAIISILSGIGVTAYFTAQRRARLDADIVSVYSAIRKAQNRALSPSKSEFGINENDTLCRIGVSFINPNIIRPFAIYQPSTTGASCSVRRDLPDTILSSAVFNHAGPIDLEFSPPFAENESGSQDIRLRIEGSTLSKIITVIESGLIKIN